jgi:hypothetical protein
MLNKQNLALLGITTVEFSKYNLDSIKVTPTETQATDGHVAMRVTRPRADGNEYVGNFLLNRDAAKRILSVADKTKWEAAVTEQEGGTWVTVDFDEEEHIFKQSKMDDELFPDLDAVFPKEEPQAAVVMNIHLLIHTLRCIRKVLKGSSSRAVLLTLYGHDKAVRIDAVNRTTEQRAAVLIMPMDMEKTELRREYPGVDAPIKEATENQ